MSMRYLIRNESPENLSELKAKYPNLDSELGPAGEGYRRLITVTFSPMSSAHYTLVTRKSGDGWKWVCPGIEFDVENEKALFALCEQYGVPRPIHLVRGTPPQS